MYVMCHANWLEIVHLYKEHTHKTLTYMYVDFSTTALQYGLMFFSFRASGRVLN